MSARLACAVSVLLAMPGCYLVHERRTPRDGGPDAPMDVFTPPPPDAAASCVLTCAPAIEVASAPLRAGWTSTGPPSMIATPEGAFLLAFARPSSGSSDEWLPTVFRFDAATGALDAFEEAPALGRYEPLHGGDLRITPDGARSLVMRDTERAMRAPVARVDSVAWTRAGALLAQREQIADATYVLRNPPQGNFATVFPFGARDIAMIADRGFVHAFVVDAAAETVDMVDLVRLRDTGSLAPLSGTTLDDGTLVIAGGGRPPGGVAVRAAFLAVGRLEAAPLAGDPVIGTPSDPPPQVVRDGAGFALARHVTEPDDLAASGIRLQHRRADGTLVRETRVRTLDGRPPRAMALFESERGPGIAWTELPDDGDEVGDLRVLVPGTDAACDTMRVDAVLRIEPAAIAIAAVVERSAGHEGDVLVAVTTSSPDGPSTLRLLRVGGCRVTGP